MKKLLMVAALAFGLSFSSCSSDDDSSNSIGSVLGKWNPVSEKYSLNGTTVYEEAYVHTTGCNKDYYEVLESGTINEVEYFGSSCSESTYESTYTRSGNTLTVNEDGFVTAYQILVANANTLVLRESQSESGITGNLDYTYTRE